MRNLKQVLSLVLALALVFSLGMTGASALATDFKDVEDIVHTSAVDVLTELQVINGYDDNTFRPTKTITRAELCKIIAITLNGSTNLTLNPAAKPDFSDTKGHWAESVIDYCVEQGIVAGDGGPGSTFRPEDPVTVGEAFKMILVAIGYNAERAEFVGPQWLTKVTVAQSNCDPKLDDNTSMSVVDALTRDNAAQVLWNAMRTAMKTYENNGFAPDGKGGFVPSYKLVDYVRHTATAEAWTLLSRFFKVERETGIVVANEVAGLDFSGAAVAAGSTAKDGQTKLDIDGTTKTFDISTGMDVLGLEVEVFSKKVDNKWVMVGSPIPTSNNTVVEIKAGDKIIEKAKDGDVSFSTSANALKNFTTATTVSNTDKAGYGSVTRAIDNGEDKFVLITTPTLTEVTKIDSKNKVTFKGINSNNAFEANKIITDLTLSKEDMVLVTEIGNKIYVEEATTVTGTISKRSASEVTANGVTMKRSDVAYATGLSNKITNATNAGATNALSRLDFDTEYLFYVDKDDAVIGYKELEAGDARYMVILETGKSDSNDIGSNETYKVRAVTANTTEPEIYEVKTDSKSRDAVVRKGKEQTGKNQQLWHEVFNIPLNGRMEATDAPVLARYTIDSDGVVTLFDAVQIDTAAASKIPALKEKQTAYKGTPVSYVTTGANNNALVLNPTGTVNAVANSKTAVFYADTNDDNEYEVTYAKTGTANVKETDNAVSAVAVVDGTIVKAVLFISDSINENEKTATYVYVSQMTGQESDDKWSYEISQLEDNDDEDFAEVVSKDQIVATGFYKLGSDVNGNSTLRNITSSKISSYMGATVTDYEDGTLTFTHGGNSYSVVVDEDLVVFYQENLTWGNELDTTGSINTDDLPSSGTPSSITINILVNTEENTALVIVSDLEV